MALSDHEKKLLDQIEQTLRTEDPGLESSLRSARRRPPASTFAIAAIASLVIGFVVLFTGLRLKDSLGTVLGVLGYVMIVAAGESGVQALRGKSGPRRLRLKRPSRPSTS